jgi:hypothetical protein
MMGGAASAEGRQSLHHLRQVGNGDGLIGTLIGADQKTMGDAGGDSGLSAAAF